MDAEAQLQKGLDRLGVKLSAARCRQLLTYLDELCRWTERINLTAIRDPEEGVEKHLLDSLTLVTMLRGDERLLDIGSGAGLPGIPLKIALPGLELVSLDAVEKKIVFQRHVVRKLDLEASLLHGRIEHMDGVADYRQGFEVVTARAFTSLEKLLDLARPMLKQGGRVLAMKGPEGDAEWQHCEKVLPQWVCTEVKRLQLPFSGAERRVYDLVFKGDDH